MSSSDHQQDPDPISPPTATPSSSGGVALRYVFPVFWMTSRLVVMGATPKDGATAMSGMAIAGHSVMSMNGLLLQTDADPSSIARYKLGEVLSETVEGHDFLQAQFYLDEATSLRLTLAVPRGAVAGFYARRDSPPSFTSYELFHVVDANKVVLTTSSLRHRRRSSDDLQHTSVRLISSLSFINTPRSVSESHLLTHSHLCHTVICCRNSTKTDSNCY